MGRKSKKKENKPSSSATADNAAEVKPELTKDVKREITESVNVLLDKCMKAAGTGAQQEWDEFIDLYDSVEKIKRLQSGFNSSPKKREEYFGKFFDWLMEHKVDTQNIEIQYFEGHGFGLQAAKDIQENDMVMAVPRKLMMTLDTAKNSSLGPLIVEDKILQAMPNVTLALFLLLEKKSENSFWKPYLDILPDSYTTSLYLTPEEIQLLKGSPTLNDCTNQFRNIARQYAYFYRLFQRTQAADKLPFKDNFTYDDYRWAVSTIMTRQNLIPSSDGSKLSYGLIPLWDMCNHCSGHITTDYNVQNECGECYALNEYKKGDEIFIFYGARTNAELLIHNGFIFFENEYDKVTVKLARIISYQTVLLFEATRENIEAVQISRIFIMDRPSELYNTGVFALMCDQGISKSDPLFNEKTEALKKVGLPTSRIYFLQCGPDVIDKELLSFLRIFSADEENLKELSTAEDTKERLGDFDNPLSKENEIKVWTFLETRASLLLKAYPATVQEDEEKLKSGDLSDSSKLVISLRICEKRILQNAAEYAERKKTHPRLKIES